MTQHYRIKKLYSNEILITVVNVRYIKYQYQKQWQNQFKDYLP